MKFKIKDYVYPFEIIQLYSSLQKSKFFTKEELVELQNLKLRKLIDHSYKHVPYYREIFDDNNLRPTDIRREEDLTKMPVLTKDIIRKRYKDLIANNCKSFNPYINKTSGSTGSPLKFLQDKHTSIARFAFLWHTWHEAGYYPFMKTAQIDQMYLTENDCLWHYNTMLNSLQIAATAIHEKNISRIIQKLNKFKPKIIRGYPSAMYLLALYAMQNNIKLEIDLRSVITNAETLQLKQRELIENYFQCEVFDVYHMWEGVCLISECKHHTKHQQMEYSIMELLDDNNQPVSKGEIGEIVGTSFYNYSMPFIRYKTRDIASQTKASCLCNRNHICVDSIDGRVEDYITTPSMLKIGRVDQIFKYIDGVDFAQIVQDKVESINIFIVKNHLFEYNDLKIITEELYKRGGEGLHVEFIFVDEIKPSKNGKRRLVISNLKNV